MKVKTKKAINIVLIVLIIILVLFFLFMLLWGKSFSKFRTNVNSSAESSIAKPILVVDGDKNIKIDGIEDTVYEFSVKNYKGLEISDVDMEYSIQIGNDSEADLQFELVKDGKSITLKNNKTETMKLNGITRDSDNYELTIKYKNNPAILEDIEGNVQIKVEAFQSEVV